MSVELHIFVVIFWSLSLKICKEDKKQRMASTKKITQIAESRKNARNLPHKNSKKNKNGRSGSPKSIINSIFGQLPSGVFLTKLAVLIGILTFLISILVPFTILFMKQNYDINLIDFHGTADVAEVNSVQRSWNNVINTIISARRRIFGDERLEQAINGFKGIEDNTSVNPDIRIALGFGACTDLFVDGVKVFMKSNKVPSKSQLHPDLETVDQLIEMFAFYFEKGTASE